MHNVVLTPASSKVMDVHRSFTTTYDRIDSGHPRLVNHQISEERIASWRESGSCKQNKKKSADRQLELDFW